jgi:hypothetical protein
VDLVSINTGSWIVFGDDTPDRQVSYFNKLTTDAWFTFAGFKGYASLPFAWTVETRYAMDAKLSDLTRRAFAPADMNLYLGKKFLFLEPRIGILLPLFYPTDRAWIGSKNVRLQLGVGLNANVHEVEKVNISGEIMWQLYISGNKNIEDALAYPGSWDLLPAFKFSVKPNDQWRLGLEILGFIKKNHWVWLESREHYEATFGAVPNLFVDYDLTEKFNLGLKAGYGPSVKGVFSERTRLSTKNLRYAENSLNISLNFSIYNY